jgi:NDP-sugar pyrophosphorylase family protein
MQCVILAGGLGTRLGSITRIIPKAMVPINGRPFVDYQLGWLARNSITSVVFCIAHLGEQIAAHLGHGDAFGLKVRYVEDGEVLRGTGGALRRALDAGMLAESFFVLYGDSFLPIPFPPVFEHFRGCGRAALMTVTRNEGRWDCSNVVFAPPRVALYDKRADETTRRLMTHIDYGLSVLSRNLIADHIPPGTTYDLAELYHRLSLAGDLMGYEIVERFYEIGSPAGIADFSDYVAGSPHY